MRIDKPGATARSGRSVMAQRVRAIPWELYEEHLDEATFLWAQWERAMSAATHTVHEVAVGPEERLLAHLDGLVLGGEPVAARLLAPALGADESTRISAAGWVLLDSGRPEWRQRVWDALLAATHPGQRRALARAFSLSSGGDLAAWLCARLGSAGDTADAVIVDTVAAHDRHLLERLPLEQLGMNATGELLAAVLRAIQRLPLPRPQALVERGFMSGDDETRAAAIETGTLLRMNGTGTVCRQVIAERGPCLRLAMSALAVLGNGTDLQRLLDWTRVPEIAADALWALAFAGRVDCAERLLGVVDDPALGPVAADSFATITGLAIEGRFVCPGTPSSLDDVIDVDATVPEPSADEALLAPNPEAVRAWWHANEGRFAGVERLVLGAPWSEASVGAAVLRSPTWRRRAFRLGMGVEAAARIDLRTWARRQLS